MTMETLKIGWIDYSKEDRNKALNVINLLSEPGSVDELGVGVIRDAYSNIFFPGTSTIQTRAKYFLIVPYLFYEIEKSKTMSSTRMLDELHEKELDLIEVLKSEEELGIIGELSGRSLKRKPSEIYWNGLKTFGIFKGENLSMDEYLRIVSKWKSDKKLKSSATIKVDRNIDGDYDDADACFGDYIGFWSAPIPECNWREKLSITLTKDEASYLKAQIVKSRPESLMAQALKQESSDFYEAECFEQLDGIITSFSNDTQKHYHEAKRFAEFLQGIQLRFNIILSQGKKENLTDDWIKWWADESKYKSIDLGFIRSLGVSNESLFYFLEKCQAAMLDERIDDLDQLIIARERKLKGLSRAKTSNVNDFVYKGWVGLSRLQYRFDRAKRIMQEIHIGLEG